MLGSVGLSCGLRRSTDIFDSVENMDSCTSLLVLRSH